MTKRSLDEELDAILADDSVIGMPAPRVSASSADSRMRQDFEEICRFVAEHGRPPEEPSANDGRQVSTTERGLAIRLKKYRAMPDVAESLKPCDLYNLLTPPMAEHDAAVAAPSTLEEILDMDDDILSSAHDGIFDLKFVGARKAKPDFVAEREPCEDFARFKPLFDACVADIGSGRRRTLRFANEQEIETGDFFILDGIVVYVAEMNDVHIRNGRRDARLRCIFDNGTESDMLLRSLASRLYSDQNGRRVSNPEAGPLFGSAVAEGDVRKGCVYIASSLSRSPEIGGRRDLYKIGVTNGKAERRVRRAEFDPTFLMAPAKLLKTYTIYNADPAKVESILHAFFGEACLDVEVNDRFGRAVKPREWFVVPMDALDFGIQRLFDGTISRYRYDRRTQAVVEA